MNEPDAPRPWGLSPTDKQGNTIVLHHYKQQSEGPIIAMPDKHHSIGDRGQHPNGNRKGGGINNRDEFNSWKKEFWKSQSENERDSRSGC